MGSFEEVQGLQPRPGNRPLDSHWNDGALQRAAQRIINTNDRLGKPTVKPRLQILADDGSVITEIETVGEPSMSQEKRLVLLVKEFREVASVVLGGIRSKDSFFINFLLCRV